MDWGNSGNEQPRNRKLPRQHRETVNAWRHVAIVPLHQMQPKSRHGWSQEAGERVDLCGVCGGDGEEMRRDQAKRGTELPWAKLTEQAVRDARGEYERARAAIAHINEHYSVAGIARRYGVSTSAMEKVLNYSTWIHVR